MAAAADATSDEIENANSFETTFFKTIVLMTSNDNFFFIFDSIDSSSLDGRENSQQVK